MRKPKIAFFHGLQESQVALVIAAFPKEFDLSMACGPSTAAQQRDALQDADFLVVHRARIHAEGVARAQRLKLVQILGADHDGLDLRMFRERSIFISNNGVAHSHAVADQAVLMMLALYRRVVQADGQVRSGGWKGDVEGLDTFELANKVVGIVGLGNIGQKVARRVQAFDARVQYVDSHPLAPRLERQWGVQRVPLDELIATSDILSLHVPLTNGTRQLINRERLQSMRRSAILINTSAGQVVDEAALATALADGSIAGAGLDAFSQEPVARDSPLLTLDNVILSPHCAGTTADTWYRRGQFAAQNMRRVLDGYAPESLLPH